MDVLNLLLTKNQFLQNSLIFSKNSQECLQKSSNITQNSNSPFSSRRSVRSVPCYGLDKSELFSCNFTLIYLLSSILSGRRRYFSQLECPHFFLLCLLNWNCRVWDSMLSGLWLWRPWSADAGVGVTGQSITALSGHHTPRNITIQLPMILY